MDNVTSVPIFRTTLASFAENVSPQFVWYDYISLLIMLALSGGLGIWFGCFKDKTITAKEYLLGGNNMKIVPVAISLIASHTSGITLLGVPADAYAFGASYALGSISVLIVGIVTATAFIPVFHELQLISTYEYLGLRFDKKTRKLSSFTFALSVFLYLPIVIYMPALALSAATGIEIHVLTFAVCGLCIFYTSIGGIKALVWIDTLQFTTTFGTVLVVLVMGINRFGGLSKLLNTKPVQDRTDFLDLAFDFTKRDTTWALLVGFTIHWLTHTGVNQGCVQKFLSVPTLKKSRIVIIAYCIGMAFIKLCAVVLGLVLSATYAECDPFVTKKIERTDQLLPYYVLHVAKDIPGLSGLFTAGVLTASLSTLSGNLNSLSGTIHEDFLKMALARKGIVNDGLVLKILVVIIGVLSTLLVYVVENMGGMLSLAIGLGSVAHGPLLGMFFLGMFFPRANSKGSFFGAVASIIIMSVVITGGNVYKLTKKLVYAHKPISVDQCDFFVNTTLTTPLINKTLTETGSDIFPIFRISFYWYTLIGCTICVVVGLIISFLTEENDPPIPRKLLSPIIHPFLSEDRKKEEVYYKDVDDAINDLQSDEDENHEEKLKERLRKISYVSEKFDV